MTNRVRAIDLATQFKVPENEIEVRLIRACARSEIAAWAGKALFREGDISLRETDWQIPPEAWIAPSSTSYPDFNGPCVNPKLSLRDGTLCGKGFSPVVLWGDEPRAVDISSISFTLTRLEFDKDDVSYYLRNPSSSSNAGDALSSAPPSEAPQRPKVSVGAKADAQRWEQFAAALAVLFERGELGSTSSAKNHAIVAAYLAARGHDDALGIDTVRSLLLRTKAWYAGNPYTDDADYGS